MEIILNGRKTFSAPPKQSASHQTLIGPVTSCVKSFRLEVCRADVGESSRTEHPLHSIIVDLAGLSGLNQLPIANCNKASS